MLLRNKKALTTGFVIATLLVSLLLVMLRDRRGETPVYRKAARRALAGKQFYRPDDHPAFTYPPFFVLAYLPLTRVPATVARFGWYVINFSLLAAIVTLLARMTHPVLNSSDSDHLWRRRRRTALAYGLTGLLAARFVISPIEYQSHDLIVMLFAVLAIGNIGRQAQCRAGAWAGLAAACKATPLLFLVSFACQRRARALAAMLLAVAGATLLPDLFFTNPDGELWVQTWYRLFVAKVDISGPAHAANVWTRWNMLNQSLSGTMYRLTTYVANPSELCWDASIVSLDSGGRRLATMTAQLLVMLGLLYAVQPRWLRGVQGSELRFRALGQGSAVLCAMLLLSPMTSKQHFCFLLAPLAFLVSDLIGRRPTVSTVGTLVLVLLLGTLGGKDVVGKWLQMRMAGYGSLTWSTVACLLACGGVLRARYRSGVNAVEQPARGTHQLIPTAPARRAA